MKPRFLHVNRTFQPHLVIFNNLAWPPGTYTQFQAERFHTVLGAVDIDRFHPTDERPREQSGPIVLGGLANKNAEALVDALALLPDNVSLKLLGNADALLDARPDLRRMPRIERVGVLFEDELPSFYRNIDIAVHTEMRGGWSNFAAEAMASGVPLICTPHGTTAFARDGETAVVLEKPSASAISAAVERLLSDNARAANLARNATEAIRAFSWQMYAARLGPVLGLQQ
jgi:glycosyltransferase involved in cell wall biosynthesis